VRTGFFFIWLQSARLPSEDPDTHSVPVTYATQSMACPYPLQYGVQHSATLQACSRCSLPLAPRRAIKHTTDLDAEQSLTQNVDVSDAQLTEQSST
jgi:hypothetical protein